MAPASDVKRFAAYLNDLSNASSHKPERVRQAPSAADTDFEETQELLAQFQHDERLRNVLMDTTETTLTETLQSVQDELREVEGRSIAAYIEEAQPLNKLHEQARIDHPCLHAT